MSDVPKKWASTWKATYKKVQEVISYLSQSFSSKLLERADIKQYLWVLLMEVIKEDKLYYTREPGWYFMKFKWRLIRLYQKEVKRINEEWDYRNLIERLRKTETRKSSMAEGLSRRYHGKI